MGWYGSYEQIDCDGIRERFLGRVEGYSYAPGVTVTDATWRGTTLWGVLRSDGRPTLIICWLTDRRRVRGATDSWAYKPLDETMGPVEVNCPLRLLDLVPCPSGEHAASWRERVRAEAARVRGARAVRRSLAVGDRIEHGGDAGVVVAVTYRGRRALICDFSDYRGSGVTRRFRVASGAITRTYSAGAGCDSCGVADRALGSRYCADCGAGPCLCGDRTVMECGDKGCQL